MSFGQLTALAQLGAQLGALEHRRHCYPADRCAAPPASCPTLPAALPAALLPAPPAVPRVPSALSLLLRMSSPPAQRPPLHRPRCRTPSSHTSCEHQEGRRLRSRGQGRGAGLESTPWAGQLMCKTCGGHTRGRRMRVQDEAGFVARSLQEEGGNRWNGQPQLARGPPARGP